ncbi:MULTISPECIES: GatB/YqeY domain-containing protein [unclassified Wenzhouxiangella]|uniref:GatB/YqeY domain-containing protein n=1 Tax=unclassified Wenzhouxiangella TaxID=2613841 RepID=UPI000E32A5DF|nr:MULTISPECIES: GatB/YqeY domain-containing protein [unclassified Wenzhouxiangella]RFF28592.1 GatB/YqeY domain-containing protein [Wenzhouxiangella sp. 15181]RFP68133.1 GatB/YqeY domain-containing protein [Wenzhouxiangella sp. 15190]
MSLKAQINDDVKQAMRSGEKERLKTLRMITAAIKQREIDERTELDDAQVLAVVEKMIKQRRESAEQYREGNRPELAEAEEAEIALLEPYLPEQLSDEELDKAVDEAISETGASDMSGMGQVMGLLKPRLQGRADMSKVSGLVRSKLAG